MGLLRRLAATAIIAILALPASAANRCVTPTGRIVYTNDTCEAVGAKLEREVTREISVVPLPPSAVAPKPKPAGKKEPRRLPSGIPVLTACYDPKDARSEVPHEAVEDSVRNAVAAWNPGCNVYFEYLGRCPEDPERDDRPVEFRVRWVKFEAALQFDGKSYREHAVAAANLAYGVGLNRDIDGRAFATSLHRAMVHEFGHVAGVGHSQDPSDVMFPGSRADRPSARDFAACNRAVDGTYGPPRPR